MKRNLPNIVMIVVIAALALSGCSLASHYNKPAVQIPPGWKTNDPSWKEAAPRDDIPKGEWWKIFRDPLLDNLEKEAIQYNQDLKKAFASLNQARAEARLEIFQFYPRLFLNPEYTRERTSNNVTPGFTPKNPHSDYNIPLDLSYEIDIWGRVRSAFLAKHTEAEANEAAFHTVLLTLTADVASHYFTLRELEAEKDILEKTLSLRRNNLSLVESRFKSGLVSELDLTRAKTELADVESGRIDLDRQKIEERNSIAVLLGKSASEFDLDVTKLNIIPPVVPPGLPSELLERRPDIAEAERLMASANAEIGIARAAFFPKVTLTGSAGFESLGLSNLTNWESRFWSLGPNISIPILAGGRKKAALNVAMAKYDVAEANYRQKILVAFKEAEDSLARIRIGRDQWETQKKVVEAADRTASISGERYKQGLVNYLEVVDAERSRLQAELKSYQILVRSLISTVELIKALGGGWGR